MEERVRPCEDEGRFRRLAHVPVRRTAVVALVVSCASLAVLRPGGARLLAFTRTPGNVLGDDIPPPADDDSPQVDNGEADDPTGARAGDDDDNGDDAEGWHPTKNNSTANGTISKGLSGCVLFPFFVLFVLCQRKSSF